MSGRRITLGITKQTISRIRSFLFHLLSYNLYANSTMPTTTMRTGSPQVLRFLKIPSASLFLHGCSPLPGKKRNSNRTGNAYRNRLIVASLKIFTAVSFCIVMNLNFSDLTVDPHWPQIVLNKFQPIIKDQQGDQENDYAHKDLFC